MTSSLDPLLVRARLAGLRSRYVPESVDSAHARLALERPTEATAFDQAAARALAELRALCDLAEYLHRGRRRVS
jgi:hypothetical protein